MSKRVYISGPISGMPDENRPAFARAEASIIAAGNVAVNPHSLPHDHDHTWPSYMREDINALLTCDEVHALPGCGRLRIGIWHSNRCRRWCWIGKQIKQS